MGRPTLLRVRLVHHETSRQKDAFVSTFFCIFLTLQIVTRFSNLVLFERVQIFSLLTTFTVCECLLSLIISDTLLLTLINGNSIWYDLGATQEVLHQMRIRLSRGLPAIASPPRAESPSPSRRPAAAPVLPTCEEEFVKASKGGSSAPSTTSTGPSLPVATTSPKTEIKKKRKRKSVKRTVTSETVSPPEKRKKIVSESPDSQAEGPFCDSDTVSVSEGSPHAT